MSPQDSGTAAADADAIPALARKGRCHGSAGSYGSKLAQGQFTAMSGAQLLYRYMTMRKL